MRRLSGLIRATALCAVFVSAAATAAPAADVAPAPAPPRVFLLDGTDLVAARQRVLAGDASLAPALDKLKRDADAALTVGPFTVTSDKRIPPSGDKHDYMSQAPYWWPDPAKPDGLPYVQRDGQRNPEIYKLTDANHLKLMAVAAEQLALGYYFTGDERYAARAALVLRTWFLDEPTRMNPHLQFAQGIPGINTGRGIGIIETIYLMYVVDAVGLLHGSTHWSEADETAMRKWYADYLRWMLDSKYGKDEAAARNNHGTFYDVQAATFALFAGDEGVARRIVEEVPARRIATQVEPDGRQPHELRRTKAWSYSCMNARGLMLLARLGEHVGVDLWRHETPDGRGILKALVYIAPYATGEREWPHDQLNGFRPDAGVTLLRRAAREYPTELAPYLKKIPSNPPDALEHLAGVRMVGNPADSK